MNISDAAVDAAAKAVYGGDHLDGSPQRDAWLRDFRIALEAAAPHMFADMRPMTLVEMARRDRPEAMEEARKKVLQDRKESQAELVRAAKADAWDAAWREAVVAHPPLAELGTPNPYGETFADRMARRSLEAVASESWKAKQ